MIKRRDNDPDLPVRALAPALFLKCDKLTLAPLKIQSPNLPVPFWIGKFFAEILDIYIRNDVKFD
jgi:hypothetical protein